MKLHYFAQDVADKDDTTLGVAKMGGYVPKTCLLGGAVVMSELNHGQNPCWDCNGPRIKCGGKPKEEHSRIAGGE